MSAEELLDLPAEGEFLEIERAVDETLLTPNYGKPDIVVLASPAVVYLMEYASLQLVERDLPKGMTSVGTRMMFEHLRPSFLGARIATRATVTRIQGRRIELKVESFEDGVLIARASHSRAIVPTASFVAPSESKA